MGTVIKGQYTMTDLTDLLLTLSPSTFFIPVESTDDGLAITDSGSQTVKVTLTRGTENVPFNTVTAGTFDTDAPNITDAIDGNDTFVFTWTAGDKLPKEQILYKINVVVTANGTIVPGTIVMAAKVKGDEGDAGAQGATEVSRVKYYCVVEGTLNETTGEIEYTTPAKPTTETPSNIWTTTTPSGGLTSTQMLYTCEKINLKDDEDNTSFYYTDVTQETILNDIITDTTQLQTDTGAQGQTLDLIHRILNGTYDSDDNDEQNEAKSIYDELCNVIVKQYIIDKGDYIAEIANKMYSVIVGGDSTEGFTQMYQSTKDFNDWVTSQKTVYDDDGTEVTVPITSVLNFSADGLRIALKLPDTVESATLKALAKYSVLINNQGVFIERADDINSETFTTQARFRKQQLTIPDVRVADPEKNTLSRISMRLASDGGIIFVTDTTEEEN